MEIATKGTPENPRMYCIRRSSLVGNGLTFTAASGQFGHSDDAATFTTHSPYMLVPLRKTTINVRNGELVFNPPIVFGAREVNCCVVYTNPEGDTCLAVGISGTGIRTQDLEVL